MVDTGDYQKVKDVFKKEGLQIYSYDKSFGGRLKDRQVNCIRQDLIMIDLHRAFTWQKIDYLDQHVIWKQTEIYADERLKYPVPSLEVEFILNVVHMLYERYYLTMLDFLTLSSFIRKQPNWDLIFQQAEKYAWIDALRKFLGIFSAIRKQFSPHESLALPVKVENFELKSNVEFPYFFSIGFIMGLYGERLIKKAHIDPIALAYFFYTRFKYYLSGKKILPYFTNEAYREVLEL